MVYDCTQRQTFNSILNWIKQIEEHAEKDVLKVLIANKIDKSNDIVVPLEEGKQLALKHGLEFFTTSAKTGEGVEDLFGSTCRKVISQEMLRAERKQMSGEIADNGQKLGDQDKVQ